MKRDSGLGTRQPSTRFADSKAAAHTYSSLPFCCIELADCRDLLSLAAAFPDRYPGLLESAARARHGRWDILFAFPHDSLMLHADGRVRDARGADRGAQFLDALDAIWQSERKLCTPLPPGEGQGVRVRDSRKKPSMASDPIGILPHPQPLPWLRPHPAFGHPLPTGEGKSDLPFTGGWLLYLGYELAEEIEPRLRLPRTSRTRIPVAVALRCPATILVDREHGRTLLIAESRHVDLLEVMRRDLDNVATRTLTGDLPAPIEIAEEDPRRFLTGVARAHDYLRAGDTFQVNLSRVWQAHYAARPDSAAIYRALRCANPAPFAGLLQFEDWAIASSSPERLLEIRAGIAQTRPIAGTRPRLAGDDDAACVRELLAHAKERAEHVMLIDLARNDLGRICLPGSVEVDEMMAIESYAHVHHIVSNVRGRIRRGVTPGQAIAAVFPGGTITGCPKVRCMEIIAELEGAARGPYTGALGYLNRNGDMDLNILIRTLQIEGSWVTFRAGAGVVIDSVASHELAETRAKARGLLRALGTGA